MSRNRPKEVNSRCSLVSNAENETLFRLVGHNCWTLSSAVVQLFLADTDGRQWNKRFCGIACFVKDSNLRSFFIRIFDIKKEQLVWQQELYNQFRYKAPRDFLHTFEADRCQAALNFASEDEAVQFKGIIDQKLTERHQRRMLRKSRMAPNANATGNTGVQSAAKNTAPQAPVPAPPVHTTVNIDLKKNNQKEVKNNTSKGNKKGQGKLRKEDIGGPSNFRHVNHVGFDPNKGFEMGNLDPDMKKLFQSVGIKPDDNIDQDTMEFIYDFVDRNGGMDAVKKEMAKKSSPPPPPPITRSAAPPLPGRPTPARPPAVPAASKGRTPPPPIPSGAPPPPPPARKMSGPPPPPPSFSSRGPPPPAPNNFPPPPPPFKASPPGPPPPPPPGAPPPPPCAAPPPPPPPPPGDEPPSASSQGRGGLLAQIHQGMALKKVNSNDSGRRPSDARGDLLDAIKGGSSTLKRVESNNEKPAPQLEDEGGLVGALAQALSKRKTIIQGLDDDDDDDDEDDFDDDEWD